MSEEWAGEAGHGDGFGRASTRRRTQRRTPKAPTPQRLERWAHHYLERYASSAANLVAVLERRVARGAEELGTDVEAVGEEIEALVARLVERGYVDDRAFAKSLVRKLRARGSSSALIRSRLRSKGISSSLIDEVSSGEGVGDPDLAAALRYARRRGLGPYRANPEARSERRERDLAALGRAGFGYGVAASIIDARDVDALERTLGPGS